jgi:hypothetical protein
MTGRQGLGIGPAMDPLARLRVFADDIGGIDVFRVRIAPHGIRGHNAGAVSRA